MTPAAGHPAAHVLADLAEGVLDAGRADEIEQHVRTCPECADTVARLGEVTAILGAAPPVVPMPAHVSARIATALAAERAAEPAEPADQQLGTVSHLTPVEPNGSVAWFRRRLPQALAAAASVAVIGFAGYVVTSDTGNGGATTASSAGDAADLPERAGVDDAYGTAAEDAAPEVLDDATPAEGLDTTKLDATSPYSNDAVGAAMTDVWRTRVSFADGCGQVLADAEGQALVGSTELGADVLVVLESTDRRELLGWLVPTCSSGTAEALAEAVTIPTPAG